MANIINRQQTFSTNGTVTAAGLHNLIDSALVNSAIIKNQQEITTIGTADLLLIAPDSVDASLAPRKVTVQNLLDDGLTAGTFTSFNLTGALTYGTATGNRTVSTSATITTGTIPNLTAGTTTSTAATITNGTITNGTITTALIPTLTAGTTTGTAGIFTSGTVNTLNSTTGTITNLSTTLAGDFTISQGTGTLGTTGATLGTYGGATSVPVLAINAKGQVTSTGTAAITSGLTGFRNRIINGDMRIWQRGTSYNMTASWAYGSVDRWICTSSPSASGFFNRSTSVPTGFQYSVQMGRTAASTVTSPIQCLQAIESVNCYGLQGQTVTLSFWARAGANFSSSGGILYSGFGTGTVADQAASGFYSWTGSTLQGQNNTLTTTWTRYTYTATIASDVLEVGIVFSYTPTGTAGADDSVYITGVQLEAGSTATEFERRPIGTELALCQRYFEKSYALATAIGTNTTVGLHQGVNTSDGNQVTGLRFLVAKRAIPTMTVWSKGGTLATVSNTSYSDSANAGTWVAGDISEFGFRVIVGPGGLGTNNSWNCHYRSEAEL